MARGRGSPGLSSAPRTGRCAPRDRRKVSAWAAMSSSSYTASSVSSAPRTYSAVRSASWPSSSSVAPGSSTRRSRMSAGDMLASDTSRTSCPPGSTSAPEWIIITIVSCSYPAATRSTLSSWPTASLSTDTYDAAGPLRRARRRLLASTSDAGTAAVTAMRLWYRENGNSVAAPRSPKEGPRFR